MCCLPYGTGSVKGLSSEQLQDAGCQVCLPGRGPIGPPQHPRPPRPPQHPRPAQPPRLPKPPRPPGPPGPDWSPRPPRPPRPSQLRGPAGPPEPHWSPRPAVFPRKGLPFVQRVLSALEPCVFPANSPTVTWASSASWEGAAFP
eukprot:366275-Chlamydomonas_euryale.AAC.5